MTRDEAAKLLEITDEARRLVKSERRINDASRWVFVEGRHVARLGVLLRQYDEVRARGGRSERIAT